MNLKLLSHSNIVVEINDRVWSETDTLTVNELESLFKTFPSAKLMEQSIRLN